jgi:hypothetical protein
VRVQSVLFVPRLTTLAEKSLKQLYAVQQAKIEDIKKKTNYYRTRDIIAKYDETPSASPSAPGKGQSPQARPNARQPAMPVTPQRSTGPSVPAGTPQAPQTPLRPGLQTQLAGKHRVVRASFRITSLFLTRSLTLTTPPSSAQAMA